MGHRQEARVELNSSATLCGVDGRGHSFLQPVIIRNISGRGILLATENCKAKAGEIVVLRYGKHRGRFQVVRTSEEQDGTKLLGLEHALPSTLFWGLDLPEASSDPYFRPRLLSRRRNPRFTAELRVEVRVSARVPVWSTTANISEYGCFIYMLNCPPPLARVDVAFWLGPAKYWVECMVVSSEAGFGMGVKFLAMSEEARYRLRKAIEDTEEVKDRRAAKDIEWECETETDGDSREKDPVVCSTLVTA